MASGKKGKKAKGKTLNLNDFLQENAGSTPIQTIRKTNTNWADEVDEYDGYDRKPMNVVLPTAPKASRDYDDITDKVPIDPPFSAYLSNLPYDVDEDEIADFFRDMKIAGMRIPKDDRGGESKSKGYGYVEFEDRESLLSALVLPDTTLKNRRIRIEVASNNDNDRRRGGRMDMGRDRGERTDSLGDWRSGSRTESNDNDRRGGGYNRDRDGTSFNRENMRGGDREEKSFSRENMRGGDREEKSFSRENMRDRDYGRDRDRDNFRSTRESDDKPGAWRDADRNQDRDRGFNRDRGNYRDSDRGNYRDSDRGNYRDSDRGNYRDSDRGNYRDSDRGNYRDSDRGNYRDSDRGNYRDSDRSRYDDRGPRRYDNDRDRDRNNGYSRRDDRDSENAPSEPRERPRLMLAPRSKPVETLPMKTETVPSASIFGSAKPVDTSQREREIEEKLARGHSDKPRESSVDKKYPSSDEGEKKDVERSRPSRKTENSPPGDRDNKDGPPPRRNYDDRRVPSRTEQRSPDKTDNRQKSERTDKPRREEKRDKPEKEMPKLAEVEPPNFVASNKFAFLDTEDGLD